MTKRKNSFCSGGLVVALIIFVGIGYTKAANVIENIEQTKSQILSFIEAGKLAEADAITAGIMDLPDSIDKGQAIQQIAGVYQKAGQFDRSIKLCDYVLKNWPREGFAVWAEMTLTLSQLGKGDTTTAKKTIERITNDYANDVNLPRVLFIIADSYAEKKMDTEAWKIRESIVDKSPESIYGAGMKALSLVNQKGYSIAQRRLNSLIADFNGNPDLPEMVFRIGQEFCWKRRYSEAKDAFDRMNDLPNNAFTQKARLWSATANTCALIRQSKDEEATASISKLIKDFEAEAGLAEAVYRIGQEFEWSKGELAASAANYNASANIHRQLLQQFSKTPYGKQSYWDYKRLGHRINILTLIEKDDAAGAEAAIEGMAADLAGRPELAGEIHWIEMWSNDHQKYEIVKKLDERLIRDFPNTNESAQAFWRIAGTIIEADEQAGKTIDDTIGQIRTRFTDNSNRLAVLISGGKVYQEKAAKENNTAYLEKAIRLFQEASQITSSPDIYMQLAACYQGLGKFAEAINCYEEVTKKWPNSPLVTECLMSIEKCNIKIKSASTDKSGEGK
jgi:tetratricopeptide (TPR) repeat protein